MGTLSFGFGSFIIPFPHFRELPLEDRDFLPPTLLDEDLCFYAAMKT